MLAYPIFSQDNDSKRSTIKKQVNTEINEIDGMRYITVRVITGDDEQVIAWEDEGIMPADIKQKLDEAGIQVDFDKTPRRRVKIFTTTDEEEFIFPDINRREEFRKQMLENRENARDRARINRSEREDRFNRSPFNQEEFMSSFRFNKPSNSYLGVKLGESKDGALIEDVAAEGPAGIAGIQKGDLVTSVNGARIKKTDDLLQILYFFDPADTIEISVLRAGADKKIKIKLTERPDAFR